MKSITRALLICLALSSTVIAALLYLNRVDNSLSPLDRSTIPLYMSTELKPGDSLSFEQEITLIRDIQRSVLEVVSGNRGIPHGHERELRDIYLEKSGLCYDRSRAIEKILRFYGFETRHISLFELGNGSLMSALISRDTESHAITEVKTTKGWLVVDSNDPWVSLDANGVPISIRNIRDNFNRFSWRDGRPNSIYGRRVDFIYGLYSRHGGFYPPYTPIPDIHYGEFLQNFGF